MTIGTETPNCDFCHEAGVAEPATHRTSADHRDLMGLALSPPRPHYYCDFCAEEHVSPKNSRPDDGPIVPIAEAN